MKKNLLLTCGLLVMAILASLSLLRLPVSAASTQPQAEYPSPTPQTDGRIIYIVQPGDTCLRLELLYGVSVEYIRTTNLLNENCDIIEGQRLMIGVGGPGVESPTPGPSPTATNVLPTPTLGAGGTATVCVLMYIDFNGDGFRQETEFGVDGGAISLAGVSNLFTSLQNTTSALDVDDQDEDFDTEEPFRNCFYDLAPGTYTVSGGVPENFNPTTFTDVRFILVPGDTTYVDFGVQPSTSETSEEEQGPSPLLGVIGFGLLLIGIGLAIYVWWIYRRK